MSWLRLCDALAGRTFAVGVYYVALQYSLEVLPTVARGKGAAACEIFGGLGVFLCPQIVYLVRLKEGGYAKKLVTRSIVNRVVSGPGFRC